MLFDRRAISTYKECDANPKGANDMANLKIRNYNEKRDFIRMKVETEVTLTLNSSGEQVKAYCRDLSGTGMLIEATQEIAEGTVCETRLPSNNEAFPALDAKVKGLRCTASEEDEGRFSLGMEILEIGI
jgi:hypothetical protein